MFFLNLNVQQKIKYFDFFFENISQKNQIALFFKQNLIIYYLFFFLFIMINIYFVENLISNDLDFSL